MRKFRLARWYWGLLVPMLLNPAAASAQLLQGIPRSPIETMSGSTERMPEGWYVMPWVAAGVVYDDNVFFTTRDRKQEDVFLRVTPGLQGSYQSTPLTVIANYRFDSEVYNKLDNLFEQPKCQRDIRLRANADALRAEFFDLGANCAHQYRAILRQPQCGIPPRCPDEVPGRVRILERHL
jgi:hypothetical protein